MLVTAYGTRMRRKAPSTPFRTICGLGGKEEICSAAQFFPFSVDFRGRAVRGFSELNGIRRSRSVDREREP